MQKKVGDALYVLDLTPYVITEDTDVSIIYVQNEKIKEYKELNTELASKMHGFNQFIMAVQPLPWAEDGDGESGGETSGHTLTLDGSDIHGHVDVYLNNEQVQTTIEYTDVAAGTAIKITPEQGASPSWYTVERGVEWDDNVQAWVATMPDEDYRITMNYNGQPQKISPELAWSSDSATVTIDAVDNVFPTLTNPHGVIVEYTSSNTTAADITNQNAGTIGLYSAGTTTITATFDGDETYLADSVSYTLTVEEAGSGESGESGES